MRYLMLFMFFMVSTGTLAQGFQAGPSGGSEGNEFIDNPPNDFAQLHSIRVCAADLIHSIEVSYYDVNGNIYSYGKHGGGTGACSVLNFMSGEYVTSFAGRYGSSYVRNLTITTNYNRKFVMGSTSGGVPFSYDSNAQFTVAGVKGLDTTSRIKAIGVVYVQTY